jgi:hypothetical protein
MRHVPVARRRVACRCRVCVGAGERPVATRCRRARRSVCRSKVPERAASVTGAAVSCRLWRALRIEGRSRRLRENRGEATKGISFRTPARMRRVKRSCKGVIARRTSVNKAGLGFAAAAAVETGTGPSEPRTARRRQRPPIRVRRGHDHPSRPEGVTVEQAERTLPDARGQRGAAVLLVWRPAFRFVSPAISTWRQSALGMGGPARIGNNYDEAAAGARIAWTF